MKDIDPVIAIQQYLTFDIVAFILSTVVLWLLGRFLLRGYLRYRELHGPRRAMLHWLADFGEGLLVAVVLLLIAILPAWLAGAFNPSAQGWQDFHPVLTAVDNPLRLQVAGLFAVQSLFEELLFRGVLMGLLAMLLLWLGRYAAHDGRHNRRVWFFCGLIANLVVCLGFAYVHSDNNDVTNLALVNIGLAGYLLGAQFWLKRNLWAAWGTHFMWNLGLAAVGLPVSGMTLSVPQYGFGFSGAQPGLLTGGLFGPEGGVLSGIGLLLLSAWYTWRAWRWAMEPLETAAPAAAGAVADEARAEADPPDGV